MIFQKIYITIITLHSSIFEKKIKIDLDNSVSDDADANITNVALLPYYVAKNDTLEIEHILMYSE